MLSRLWRSCSSPQTFPLVVLLLALGLRLWAHGGRHLDYDEGVYYSAAALWGQGCWPYRDFVFVHPPGLLYGLLPLTWLTPSWGLAWAQWLTCLVGTLNCWLVMRLAGSYWGPAGGCLSGLCYALYPEVVRSEHRLLLEPWLNCLILLSCLASRRQSAVWLGLALALKAWAGLWWLAAWRRLGRWSLLSLAMLALLLAPWWNQREAWLQQVVHFQLQRPPHQPGPWSERWLAIVDPRHLPITLLALWGWPQSGIFGLWLALLGLLSQAPGHFFQYNAHLALPECLLAGAAARRFRPWQLALLLSVPLGFSLAEGFRRGDPSQAQALRDHVAQESFFCFEPGPGLLADRLPQWGDGAPVIVDSYATALIASAGVLGGADDLQAQRQGLGPLRQRILSCRWILLEERARELLEPAWLQQHFRPYRGQLWLARKSSS